MNHNQKTIRKLKNNHLRLTAQRKAVLDIINNSTEYFTPAAMYNRLRENNAGVSLVTVYRSLNMLYELGLVCETRSVNNIRSYGRCLRGSHGHIVCQECGKIIAYNGCWLNKLLRQIQNESGFIVDDDNILINGLCRECRDNHNLPATR